MTGSKSESFPIRTIVHMFVPTGWRFRVQTAKILVDNPVMKASAALALALAMAPLTAGAASALSGGILPQPAAPVQIDECFANLDDTDVGNVDYYLENAAIFHAVDETAVAVRFRFDFFDPFNAFLGTRYGTVQGTFSPGVRIDQVHNHLGIAEPMWSFINIWSDVSQAVCSVETVRFDDGRIWNAQQ